MNRRINLETDIIPLSEFRKNTAAIMKRVREQKRPIVLTQNGRSAAVLLDVAEYEAQWNDAQLLEGIERGEQDIRDGNVISHEEAVRFFQQNLEKWKPSNG